MSKNTLYDLWNSLLEVAKHSYDELTGENTKSAIINEIKKYRTLTIGVKTEPKIVLDALRTHNKIQAFGITADEFANILRNYAQKGIK